LRRKQMSSFAAGKCQLEKKSVGTQKRKVTQKHASG